MINQRTNNKLKFLRNVSFTEIAYDQIRELIFSGSMEPGDHINENQLADMLEISRAPVREACRQLQKEGLVEITKNKGAFVKKISPQEAVEIYEIRIALESLAVQKAVENADESDLSQLELCVDELKAAAESKNEKAHYLAAVHFHQIISAISGNHNLSEMLVILHGKISLFRRKMSDYLDDDLSISDEIEIIEALKNRNGETAAAMMRRHILRAKNRIVEKLARENKNQDE
jgi:DNA-binding GntR family transcriptional regulator